MALALDEWDEGAFWEDDDYGVFESENWAEDDYGFYGEDFYYGTDDQWYESWYEESDVQNWGQFSAESEEGFFNF